MFDYLIHNNEFLFSSYKIQILVVVVAVAAVAAVAGWAIMEVFVHFIIVQHLVLFTLLENLRFLKFQDNI